MPAVNSPFFGIQYGWTLGEDGWGDPVNSNFQVLSFLDKGAVDDVVSSLPASPVEGYSVILTTDNQIYVRFNSNWIFITPQQGMEINKISDGSKLQYNGSNWTALPSLNTLDKRTQGITNVRSFITTTVDGTTSNQSGIVSAIASCLASGNSLYWPAGTYVSDANIPNFHSVSHYGDGILKRGSNNFVVSPKAASTQQNIIYVSTSGSASNDGLTSSQPLLTFQNAFDTLSNYNLALGGVWIVDVAAGSYSITTGQQTFRTPSKNRVIIRGPAAGHPNVPACIVDGGSSGANYSHGLAFDGSGVFVQVQDILLRNFTGDPAGNTRGALLFDNGADGYTNNVHVTNCSWFGVYWSRRSQGRQQGGIIDGCRNGVNTDGAKASIGYNATSLATGTIIRNCTENGIFWARGTDGHVDFCTLDTNAIGLQIESNSRPDAVGNSFKKNTIGVRTYAGGYFGNNPNSLNVFNIGTADANIQADVEYRGFGGEITETSVQGAGSELRVAFDRTVRSVTGTTPTTLTTPYTVKAGRLRGVGKSLRVVSKGVYTVTASSTITVNIGGMAVTMAVPAAASNVVFEIEVNIYDVAGGYRAFGSLKHNLASPRFAQATSGFVSTSDQDVSIACTLTGASDTISIYRTDVFVTG